MPEDVPTHAVRVAPPSGSPLVSHRHLLSPVPVDVREDSAAFVVEVVADVGGRVLHD